MRIVNNMTEPVLWLSGFPALTSTHFIQFETCICRLQAAGVGFVKATASTDTESGSAERYRLLAPRDTRKPLAVERQADISGVFFVVNISTHSPGTQRLPRALSPCNIGSKHNAAAPTNRAAVPTEHAFAKPEPPRSLYCFSRR